MSANGHTVCPRCHPELVEYAGPTKYPLVHERGIIDHAAEELGYERDVRENFETYLQAKDGAFALVFDYRADCWTCGWHFETRSETPLTGLAP